MTKPQLLILLLIVLLVFYYLNTNPASINWTNPPHSQLYEPSEPALDCPVAESISQLTPTEQAQRKLQERQDYHWLLTHKTLADWHHEQQLTDFQYQTLLPLTDPELMETLEYFLNLLPVNYQWKELNSEFTSELIKEWTNLNFTIQETKEWLAIGLQATDAKLAHFLKTIKNLTPEETLNFSNLDQLKSEFNGN